MTVTQFHRTSLQLYRDCLRLIRHVAPGHASAKAMALRRTVRTEFVQHKHVTDTETIQALQSRAVRALSNYLLAVAAPQDPQLHSKAADYHGRSVREARQIQRNSSTTTNSSSSKTLANQPATTNSPSTSS